MTTANDNERNTFAIRAKNYIAPEVLGRMAVFQARYAALVEEAATAFELASIGHDHRCTNGIYRPDGPDLEWTENHAAADTLKMMFGGVNGHEPYLAEVFFENGRNGKTTVCVNSRNFLTDLGSNAALLEQYLCDILRKPVEELTDQERQLFAGLPALRRLLDDPAFRKDYEELALVIADADPKRAVALIEAEAFNTQLYDRRRRKRMANLVEKVGVNPV